MKHDNIEAWKTSVHERILATGKRVAVKSHTRVRKGVQDRKGGRQ